MGALKIQANFFIKHQWMSLDGWKKDNIEKAVIVAKWQRCQIFEHKSCNGHM